MEDNVGISMDYAFKFHKKDKTEISIEKKNFKKNWKKTQYTLEELQNQLQNKLDNVERNVYLDFINQIVKYVDDCQLEFKDETKKFGLNLVNTGIISFGCSSAENGLVFDLLIDKLNEKNFRNVIFFSSNENLKLNEMLHRIYQKVLTDDVMNDHFNIQKVDKFMKDLLKFNEFASIYNEICSTEPIIIIIDDLPQMNLQANNELFRILHDHLDKIPVIILCGLSQTSISLQLLFEHNTLKLTHFSSFTTKKATQIIDEVFDSTFIETDLALKFGSQCLIHFLDTFAGYDFSIKNIKHLAMLAIWDFCYSNRFVHLNNSKKHFIEQLDILTEKELKSLLDLESLKDIEIDEDNPKKELIDLFDKMKQIQQEFLIELKALHALIKVTLKNCSLHKLYSNFLSPHLDVKSELEKLSIFLMQLELDEWKTRIGCLIDDDLIQESKLIGLLRKQLDELNNLNFNVEEKKEPVISPKNMSRTQFSRLNLEKAKNAKNTSNSILKRWKQETIQLINNNYRKLENPSCSPLNELFYYDNIDFLRSINFFSYRELNMKHLINSDQFVKKIQKHFSTSSNCNDAKLSEFVKFKPEICLAFELYRESQLKVNLADWLQAYLAKIDIQREDEENSKCSKSSRKKLKTNEDELKSKFFSNVADLEYLGILEKTGKSIHYAKKLIL